MLSFQKIFSGHSRQSQVGLYNMALNINIPSQINNCDSLTSTEEPTTMTEEPTTTTEEPTTMTEEPTTTTEQTTTSGNLTSKWKLVNHNYLFDWEVGN
jgi:hypothetical protein